MYYVYILRSKTNPKKLYIGLTKDVDKRIQQHNTDDSTYSRTFAPWELEAQMGLKDKKVAEKFEMYLKRGSGQAFLKKHLLPPL